MDLTKTVQEMLASGAAKFIPWDDRYCITEEGDGYSRAARGARGSKSRYRKWMKLKRIPPNKNYLYPRYTIGRGSTPGIHVLVMRTFIGEYPEGMDIRHLNGDYNDPRLENLVYGTRKENVADAIRHGTLCMGEKHYLAKFTAFDIRTMRNMSASGYSNIHIARKYKVSHKHIWSIVRRKTWKRLHD